jgi:hypothetical protein
MTALIGTAQGRHAEIVREMLQKGADANGVDNDGEWRGTSRAAGA